ncbi:MAG: DUF1738 domain-containing protein [Bacteroidales bacterium]|nr:DUF1738 domain-containing protein [Bacteroidales bacterium]
MSTFNIYEEITNRILAEMEKGIIPWQKPWTCSNGAVSHTTGRPYSLLNQMLLMMDEPEENTTDEIPVKEYLTFNQIKAAGGSIKKGEKSKFVVFWKMYEKESVNDDGTLATEVIPLLRYYHVFEVGQCEGINRKWAGTARPKLDPVEEAEQIVTTYFGRETCKLHIHETNRAYYSPSSDLVNVPKMSQYDASAAYYSTLFHEMTHSTGHKTRLDRFITGSTFFGSEVYSKEELVAELGSAFLLNRARIDCQKAFRNSVAYLQGWSKALKGDRNLFVSAASKAEAAVNYIINGKEATNE